MWLFLFFLVESQHDALWLYFRSSCEHFITYSVSNFAKDGSSPPSDLSLWECFLKYLLGWPISYAMLTEELKFLSLEYSSFGRKPYNINLLLFQMTALQVLCYKTCLFRMTLFSSLVSVSLFFFFIFHFNLSANIGLGYLEICFYSY